MAISIHPTGRPLAHGGPPELLVDVDTNAPCEELLDDGMRLAFDGAVLRVDGPERDLLVTAHGWPVMRVRAGKVAVDLTAAIELRTLGATFAGGMEGLAAAALADATTGLRHRYDVSPNPPRAGEPATARVHTDDADVTAVTLTLLAPDAVDIAATMSAASTAWEATLPAYEDGTIVRYRVRVMHAEGTTEEVADAGVDFMWPRPDITFYRSPATTFSYVVGEPTMPDWYRDAVVYHVLVDRFADANGKQIDPAGTTSLLGFAGGAIAGITARLDHIASLGATAILLSPITPGEMHVCYDVKHHTAVEPRLGTIDDVRDLLDAAHARGIRVILDTEMSYLGARHPMADSAWTLRAPDGRPFGWIGGNPTFRPVDHFHPDARTHLLDAARWWLDLGFDGYRLDSAHASPFDFWTDFGAVVRAANPDAVTIAEATREPDFCGRYHGRLTGFLDFETQTALRGFAGDGSLRASELAATIEHQASTFPEALARTAFFECHDGDRLACLAQGDQRRIRVATALLLTLPGVPLLYYGTEVGMTQTESGDMDTQARQPMPWNNHDERLLAFTRDLIALRHRSSALRRGTYRTLLADDPEGVLAFERLDTATGARVLVVANASDDARTVDVPGWRAATVEPLSVLIAESDE